MTQFQATQIQLWTMIENFMEFNSNTVHSELEYCKTHNIFDLQSSQNQDLDAFANLHWLLASSQALLQHLHELSINAKNITDTLQENLSQMNKTENMKNNTAGWWDGVVDEIGTLTDKLHKERRRDFEQIVKNHGSDLETVVKLDEAEEKGKMGTLDDKTPLSIMDSKSNLFTLSHPSGIKSLSAHGEDPSLIIDILLVLVVGIILGSLFEMIGFPSFFGYLITGLVLGPSGLDAVRNVIQISSIGQIGALFLLLSLGLEFSLVKLAECYQITVLGTLGFTAVVTLACGVFGKIFLKNSLSESLFVGVIISFSSTAVSMKCMKSLESRRESYGIDKVVSGMLIMQDVIFCVLISMLPLLASKPDSTWSLLGSIIMFAFKTVFLLTISYFWCKLVAPVVYGQLKAKVNSSDDILTGTVILVSAFGAALMGHCLGLSNEFGVFLVGFIFATYPCNRPSDLVAKESNEEIYRHTEIHENTLIRNLSDIFAVFFFASIGLFIDIWFIKGELLVLFISAALFVGLKFSLMYGGLRSFSSFEPVQAALVSLNLAQISELSMVLGSKARRLGIFSKEVYFLLVATTSICLFIVPMLWKAAISALKPYQPPSASQEMDQA